MGCSRRQPPGFPPGQLFEIHSSKFEPHPVRDLSQTTVKGITHSVFFLGVSKDPLNGLFTPHVQFLVLGRVSGIIGQFFIVLPDMRRLVGGIRHHCLHLWEHLNQFVVNIIKRHTVMDIARGNYRLQHIAVFVAGGMGLIGETPFMLSLVKHPALWVCRGFRYYFLLFSPFFPPGQLLFRGVVPFLPSAFGRLIFAVQRLFPVGLPVRVDFRQQFLLISFCCYRYFLLDFLVQICTGLDVCPIYKYCRWCQRSRIPCLI